MTPCVHSVKSCASLFMHEYMLIFFFFLRSAGSDAALGKATRQLGTTGLQVSSRAVNGAVKSDASQCSLTLAGATGGWWIVDLQQSVQVSRLDSTSGTE